MANGFAQLEKIRARNRLIERRIAKKKRDSVPPTSTTATGRAPARGNFDDLADPAHRVQGPVQATGVWFNSEAGGGSQQTEAEAEPKASRAPASSQTRVLEPHPLPWALGALAPVISSRALQYHFSHHHRADIDATNRLVRGRPELAGKTLLDIVWWCSQNEPHSPLSQRASHVWNHHFFWLSLSPTKQRPTGALRQAIARDFGDYDRFAEDFARAGTELFGSGWLWLTSDRDGILRIRTCRDAGSPVTRGDRCLLAVDLWEHAYYLDYQDQRREYLEAIIDRRLDWRFAHNNYSGPPVRSSP